MIIKRLLVLQAALLLGFGSVFLIPKQSGPQPTGVTLSLPSIIGEWYGRDIAVSDREKQTLGHETEFARKSYTDLAGNGIIVSIVLAGQDMNTGIHRPERCLQAQGWTIVDSRVVTIPLDLPQCPALQTTRLHNMQSARLPDGQSVNVYNLDYFWFVGYGRLTASHIERNLIDIYDRLFKGYNQRWAFITVTAQMADDSPRTTETADRIIQKMIAELFPKIWNPVKIKDRG